MIRFFGVDLEAAETRTLPKHPAKKTEAKAVALNLVGCE